MTQRITNVDTLSALFDRMICENVKLYFFKKDNEIERVEHQEKVLKALTHRLRSLLIECMEEHGYEFLEEKRTFNIVDITEELEKLIHNDIEIGEADRQRLAAITDGKMDHNELAKGEARLRVANEGRAQGKNRIDQIAKKIFHD